MRETLLNDGKIEKYSENYVTIEESISDIHFISRSDEYHMIMVTEPQLKSCVNSRSYGMDQMFLQKASYTEEAWGIKYGRTHLIGDKKYVWEENLLLQIDLKNLKEHKVIDLLNKLEGTEMDVLSTSLDGLYPIHVYRTVKNDITQPCLTIPIADYSDMENIHKYQMIIYPDSEITEVDEFMAYQRKNMSQNSNKQQIWLEELNRIRKAGFWYGRGLEWGADEINEDTLYRLNKLYIQISDQEGLAIIQIGASAINVNDPDLLNMFPELEDYVFNDTDLINIFISDFPSNEEILSIIEAR